MTLRKAFIGVPLALCGLPCAQAQWIASSVDGFSGEQGADGWSFGYYGKAPFTPAQFEEFPSFDAQIGLWTIQDGPGGFWTRMTAKECHPNGTTGNEGRQPVEQWAVRRLESPVAGSFVLRVSTLDDDPGGGNGVVLHVFVDGVEVDTEVMNNGGRGGTPTRIPVTLDLGSIVDIAIDPRNSQDLYDSTGTTLVLAGCYADANGDGALDLFDFLTFVNAFASGSGFADCDSGSGAGVLDLFDFLCFSNEFVAGC